MADTADFVILMKFTDLGLKHITELEQWVAGWKTAWENYSGVWSSFHVTAGDYDCVFVGEAQSDEHAAAFAMWLGQAGLVTTTIMRAWSPDDIMPWTPGSSRGHPR